MRTLRILLLVAIMTAMATVAFATPYTFTFTADNVLTDLTYTDGSGTTALDLSGAANKANWQQSDSLTIDLAGGNTELIWRVENEGAVGPNNPFAFMADVVGGGSSFSSSATWQVASEVNGAPGAWVNALEYAANSGLLTDGSGNTSIWFNNNGAVAGITDDAMWIGVDEYPGSASNVMYVRMTFTATPIPAAVWLLGSGLLGMLGVRRFSSK